MRHGARARRAQLPLRPPLPGAAPGEPADAPPDHFNFNKKVDRALVFTLATGRFIAGHEAALFLGPPGTGKSHLAQAIGHAPIQQGYRVRYVEAHGLLDELAEASVDGTRREKMTELATVPLLIIDDLGSTPFSPSAHTPSSSRSSATAPYFLPPRTYSLRLALLQLACRRSQMPYRWEAREGGSPIDALIRVEPIHKHSPNNSLSKRDVFPFFQVVLCQRGHERSV